MNDKKPTEVCIASVKDPAYMHHADCSRHQEKPMGWETKFWKTVNEYGNGAHIDLVYKLKAFIDSATATAFDEGKSYWEPSEHHKEEWRKEGRADALKKVTNMKAVHEIERDPSGTYSICLKCGEQSPPRLSYCNNQWNTILDEVCATLTQEKP